MKSRKPLFSAAPEGTAVLFFIQIFATLGFAVLYSTLVLYATKHLQSLGKRGYDVEWVCLAPSITACTSSAATWAAACQCAIPPGQSRLTDFSLVVHAAAKNAADA